MANNENAELGAHAQEEKAILVLRMIGIVLEPGVVGEPLAAAAPGALESVVLALLAAVGVITAAIGFDAPQASAIKPMMNANNVVTTAEAG